MWHAREGGPNVAGLAHDLNNVFETISEAAELLGDSEDDGAAPLAAAIARSVERGRRLVDGFTHQHYAPIGLAVVIDRAADFVRDLTVLLGRPRVEVRRRFDGELNLKGPASEWERVFMNLFLNAAQAMQSGGAITVSLESNATDLVILVADEGPGIPPAILGRLFEPNVSTRSANSGLGLHIVDTIVRCQGGTVSARNRTPDPGAEFRIVLPCATP